MARDVCIDCEGDFPFGEGLTRGRCPSCREDFKARRAEARKAAKSERPAERKAEPGPEAEPEAEPEPAAAAAEEEQE